MQNIPRTDFIESTSVISAAFTVRALRIVLRTLCSLAVIIVFASGRGLAAPPSSPPATFCNPLELPYRFQLEQPVRREAADPTMVFYKGEWWLFASKSGGYWHTADFANWKFVEPTGLPLEDYAPTAEIIAGRFYFSSGHGAIYTSDNPVPGSGKNSRKCMTRQTSTFLPTTTDEFTNITGAPMPDFGTLALSLLGEVADEASADATVPFTEKLSGTLGRKLKPAPDESATVTFVLAWHFPNLSLGGALPSVGRHNTGKFSSAHAVAQYVAAQFDRLARETRLWRDIWYDSTLPSGFWTTPFSTLRFWPPRRATGLRMDVTMAGKGSAVAPNVRPRISLCSCRRAIVSRTGTRHARKY